MADLVEGSALLDGGSMDRLWPRALEDDLTSRFVRALITEVVAALE